MEQPTSRAHKAEARLFCGTQLDMKRIRVILCIRSHLTACLMHRRDSTHFGSTSITVCTSAIPIPLVGVCLSLFDFRGFI